MTTRENMQAKVRAILERANHPNTPQAEAETALALAFRLMQKYGLSGEPSASRSTEQLSPIFSRTFTISGPYRVRRASMLWEIGKTISCHSFRDMKESDPEKVVMIAFGTEIDHENRVMVSESHGAGLVLLERSERAYQAMHAFEPNLHRSISYINNDEEAYLNGKMASSQFSGGRSTLGAKKRRLEKST